MGGVAFALNHLDLGGPGGGGLGADECGDAVPVVAAHRRPERREGRAVTDGRRERQERALHDPHDALKINKKR